MEWLLQQAGNFGSPASVLPGDGHGEGTATEEFVPNANVRRIAARHIGIHTMLLNSIGRMPVAAGGGGTNRNGVQ